MTVTMEDKMVFYGLLLADKRELEPEAGADSYLALDLDLLAVGLQNLADDGQAEATASIFA